MDVFMGCFVEITEIPAVDIFDTSLLHNEAAQSEYKEV